MPSCYIHACVVANSIVAGSNGWTRGADFAIFDEETTKTIKDEHEKDMEHAAHVIGERSSELT